MINCATKNFFIYNMDLLNPSGQIRSVKTLKNVDFSNNYRLKGKPSFPKYLRIQKNITFLKKN